MAKPLVTVICLCYNHERFVRQAVESVIGQSYDHVQIIVWDDASADSSPTVIRELQTTYPQLEVCLSERNEGNCRAFNRAFASARGEFIVDFSTDDVMHPERLEKQVEFFAQRDQQTGVIFTDATYMDEQGKMLYHHFEHLFRHGLIKEIVTGDVFRAVLATYYIASPTMMMRRAVLESLGGYDEQLAYEDFDLCVRSAQLFRYGFLNERLTLIRKTAGSMSAQAYAPGDKQLMSTYRVCLKAASLLGNDEDKAALIHRVRYELRHAVLSANYPEAKAFWQLLGSLHGRHAESTLWYLVHFLRLPLTPLRNIYQRWKYQFIC